jgi:hypothetical protein
VKLKIVGLATVGAFRPLCCSILSWTFLTRYKHSIRIHQRKSSSLDDVFNLLLILSLEPDVLPPDLAPLGRLDPGLHHLDGLGRVLVDKNTRFAESGGEERRWGCEEGLATCLEVKEGLRKKESQRSGGDGREGRFVNVQGERMRVRVRRLGMTGADGDSSVVGRPERGVLRDSEEEKE